MITVRVFNIGRPLGDWVNIFRAVWDLATIIWKTEIGKPRNYIGLGSFLPLRIDTVEACGAVSIRAVVTGADILTFRVLTTLWSGFHLIANISRAVNITWPVTDWTIGPLVADIE